MNLQERTDYASMYLTETMELVGLTIFIISPDGWRFASVLDDHHATGVDIPLLRPGRFEASFCPEVIAHSTMDLTQPDFITYLGALRAHTHLHVIHSQLPLTDKEMELVILNAQRELSPTAFDLYQTVRASA